MKQSRHFNAAKTAIAGGEDARSTDQGEFNDQGGGSGGRGGGVGLARFVAKKRRLRRSGSSPTRTSPTDTEDDEGDKNQRDTPVTPRTELTEMQKQVLALKAQHPDALLLVECGYRMRIFQDDAAVAARVLGIQTNTRRGMLQTSVPVHRTLFHARKLVNAGYKVAIVQQIGLVTARADSDDATMQRQPLDREVTSIYTRGTIPDASIDGESGDSGDDFDDNSASQDARFIVALVEETVTSKPIFAQRLHEMSDKNPMWEENVRIGVFGYDVHTGECIADELVAGHDRQALLTYLALIEPIEFVIPVGGLSAATQQVLDSYSNLQARIQESACVRIERIANEEFVYPALQGDRTITGFGERTEISFNGSFPPLAALGVGGLASYLQSLKLSSSLTPVSLHHVKAMAERQSQFHLPVSSQSDLSLFRSANAGATLFDVIHYTVTPFGTRRLREWLRFPLTDVTAIQDRQRSVGCLAGTAKHSLLDIYEELTDSILPRAAHLERLLQQVHFHRASPPAVAKLLDYLTSTEIEMVKLIQCSSIQRCPPQQDIGLVGRLIREYPIASHDIASCQHEFNAATPTNVNSIEAVMSHRWLQRSGVIHLLEGIKVDMERVMSEFEDALDDCRDTLHDTNLQYCDLKTGFGKDFTHLIVVDRSKLQRVPPDWVVVSSNGSVVRYQTPRIRRIQFRHAVLVESKRQLLEAAWRDLLSWIDCKVYVPGMRSVHILSQLDALWSLATVVRIYPNYTPPLFAPDESEGLPSPRVLTIKSGRHAILDQRMEHDAYICSDIGIASGRQAGAALVISGPNMGGKSTLLRAAALIVILSQIGSFVPANSVTLSVFDGIYTRMSRTTRRIGDKYPLSSGAHETRAIGELASLVTRKSLVLLDEIGFGMTSKQARAATIGVVKYLVEVSCCHVLVATHTAEVIQHLVTSLDDRCASQVMDFEVDKPGENAVEADNAVVFRFTTKDGVATTSFALQAARIAGITEEILNEAVSWNIHQTAVYSDTLDDADQRDHSRI